MWMKKYIIILSKSEGEGIVEVWGIFLVSILNFWHSEFMFASADFIYISYRMHRAAAAIWVVLMYLGLLSNCLFISDHEPS